MSEFIEVPVEREDGSEGLRYVNIDAVSYVEVQGAQEVNKIGTIVIHLVDGYWFTLTGAKADEALGLVKSRMCVHFRTDPGGN
ncbi:MAG: hypothetical protein P4L84_04815 [Isosphaeraceae bacterium]|nr:hypothetical protein [Isosphaeraceae bacterium]